MSWVGTKPKRISFPFANQRANVRVLALRLKGVDEGRRTLTARARLFLVLAPAPRDLQLLGLDSTDAARVGPLPCFGGNSQRRSAFCSPRVALGGG